MYQKTAGFVQNETRVVIKFETPEQALIEVFDGGKYQPDKYFAKVIHKDIATRKANDYRQYITVQTERSGNDGMITQEVLVSLYIVLDPTAPQIVYEHWFSGVNTDNLMETVARAQLVTK